jgi:hypothetical protein
MAIRTGYKETTEWCRLTVIGEDFDSSQNQTITEGGQNWAATVTISEAAGLFYDALSINGTVSHLTGPHGEGPNPDSFQFAMSQDAWNSVEGRNEAVQRVSLAHGGHFDVCAVKLVWTRESTAGFSDITGYSLTIKGVHSKVAVDGVAGDGPPPAQ